MSEINYLLAIGFSLIGWAVRVSMYYFEFDTDRKFNWKIFWRKYDKYIIVGFVGGVALSFVGDLVWNLIDGWFGAEGTPYDERFNILIGFVVIPILNTWKKKNGG